MRCIILLRGINVGGKNKVPMAQLRECLVSLGFANVSTYIASGNVLLESDKKPTEIQPAVEEALQREFELDSELVKVLALTKEELQTIVADKPAGFGEEPDKYHSDVIFLMGISEDEAMKVFDPREGVDKIWVGKGVIYSRRLSAERTKSRLGKIIGTEPYKSMTIRSWNTVAKLAEKLTA